MGFSFNGNLTAVNVAPPLYTNSIYPNGNIQFTSGSGYTINNLPSCGTVSSTNTQPVIASDMFSYVANSGANTSQTYTITLSGSTTNGITWSGIPANSSTTYCQIQKVKGSGNNLITSGTVNCVSSATANSWA